MYSYIIILCLSGLQWVTFSFCFLKASVLCTCISMYVYTGSMELSWDLKILEMCPLLGTP